MQLTTTSPRLQPTVANALPPAPALALFSGRQDVSIGSGQHPGVVKPALKHQPQPKDLLGSRQLYKRIITEINRVESHWQFLQDCHAKNL